MNTTNKYTQKINSKTNLVKMSTKCRYHLLFQNSSFLLSFQKPLQVDVNTSDKKGQHKKNFWNWKLKKKNVFFWFQQTKKKKSWKQINKQSNTQTKQQTKKQSWFFLKKFFFIEKKAKGDRRKIFVTDNRFVDNSFETEFVRI